MVKTFAGVNRGLAAQMKGGKIETGQRGDRPEAEKGQNAMQPQGVITLSIYLFIVNLSLTSEREKVA